MPCTRTRSHTGQALLRRYCTPAYRAQPHPSCPDTVQRLPSVPSAPNVLPSSTLNRFFCWFRRRSRFRHTLLPCMLFRQVQVARAARAWRRPKLHVSQRVERAVRAPRRVRGSVMTPWTPLDSSPDQHIVCSALVSTTQKSHTSDGAAATHIIQTVDGHPISVRAQTWSIVKDPYSPELGLIVRPEARYLPSGLYASEFTP